MFMKYYVHNMCGAFSRYTTHWGSIVVTELENHTRVITTTSFEDGKDEEKNPLCSVLQRVI